MAGRDGLKQLTSVDAIRSALDAAVLLTEKHANAVTCDVLFDNGKFDGLSWHIHDEPAERYNADKAFRTIVEVDEKKQLQQ
jgi:hypothetical protein